jgi:hypothetical protein
VTPLLWWLVLGAASVWVFAAVAGGLLLGAVAKALKQGRRPRPVKDD